MNATYVSVWDGGTEVRTNCLYSPATREVWDIEHSAVEGLPEDVKEMILAVSMLNIGEVANLDFSETVKRIS